MSASPLIPIPPENTKLILDGDFLHNYRSYVAHTHVPRLYHEWASIIAVSSILSQQVWITRGTYRVFPNLYVMLIGAPGTGKGTTCHILKGVLDAAKFTKFAPNRTTLQKFLTDLEAGFENSHSSDPGTQSSSVDDYFGAGEDFQQRLCSDVLVLAEEFNNFMGTDNYDFISLLTELWSYYGPYRDRIKTGKSVAITNPCVNLLGGNTHDGFTMAFPPKILGQGFLARFILVHGSVSGQEESAFPDSPEIGGIGKLGEQLRSIQGNTSGELSFTSAGKLGAETVIKFYRGPEDGRFENYRTRRFVQFLKLCISIAAANGESEISDKTVITANTLLVATEAEMGKALGEFGKSRNSDVANKIMHVLYNAHKPVTLKELWVHVSRDITKYSEFSEIIQNLQSTEKIMPIKGEKFTGYLAKQEGIMQMSKADEKEARKWIDAEYYNYLREM